MFQQFYLSLVEDVVVSMSILHAAIIEYAMKYSVYQDWQLPRQLNSCDTGGKSINYLMFTVQCTKEGGMEVAMAMLPSPPTKPMTLP